MEYALIIAVTVGVLITMQQYVIRGFQGKIKESVDPLGGEHFPGTSSNKPGVESTGVGFSGDFSGASATRAVTFSYEGKRGFAINTGKVVRHEAFTAQGLANVEMPEVDNNENLADVETFKRSLDNSALMPTAEEPSDLPQEREGNNEDIHIGEETDEGTAAAADYHNDTAVDIIEEHVNSTEGVVIDPQSSQLSQEDLL